MTMTASQITSLTVVYSTVYSDADQRKHESSAWLPFVWGIHRDRWIPRTKDQLRGKCFHLMTSSCWTKITLQGHPHITLTGQPWGVFSWWHIFLVNIGSGNGVLPDGIHDLWAFQKHLWTLKSKSELLNVRALTFSSVNKIHIFQCMGKIFCVEFQRYPLKFHTKYLTHALKDMLFIQHWNFKSSQI